MKKYLLLLLFVPKILFSNTYFTYTVERSDSIESIANEFNVEEYTLIEINGVADQEYLYEGQSLMIPIKYSYNKPLVNNLTDILNNSVTNWRNPVFEVYQWDKNQQILVFDTINYSFQALMFKRLAFFVEKKDFIGSIYTLDEIEGENGWNGHDYAAWDLARFFNKVNFEGHTMTRGEEILLDIILRNGIISLTNRGYTPNKGAVISCSRSSLYNHRRTILRHEAFHGLFFTSSEFRALVAKVWKGLDYQSKTIWKMYLEVLDYNSNDEELAMNEFMAYMLQLSEDETYTYLNDIVWFRLWDFYPEKRDQINRFFNADSRPFRRQIKELQAYIDKIDIE